MNRPLTAALLLLLCATPPAFARKGCAPAASAEHDVIGTVQALFAAAKTDDLTAFHAVTTSDFYAYDAAQEFHGDALMALLGKAHAEGKKFEWHVADPTVHAGCADAWISYTNFGSIEDASGRQNVTWLESAILKYDGQRWRVHFLHSTRTPVAPTP